MIKSRVTELCNSHMMETESRYVNARLQSAIALLESVRRVPSLSLGDHKAAAGSSGLKSHETLGFQAHKRYDLPVLNKNHGRRSSNLQDWGQPLLEILRDGGFEKASIEKRNQILDEAQLAIAVIIRNIAEQDPIRVHVRGRAAEYVVGDVLDQAAEKGRLGDCAQYLVGSKLHLRFPDLKQQIKVLPANKGDRKSYSDTAARKADFELNDCAIEVAAGIADEKHLQQVISILEDAKTEVWLLTRQKNVVAWSQYLVDQLSPGDIKRVIVASVESFVGQNVTELGKFSLSGKTNNMLALIEIYNSVWVARVGTPGIQIEVKS